MDRSVPLILLLAACSAPPVAPDLPATASEGMPTPPRAMASLLEPQAASYGPFGRWRVFLSPCDRSSNLGYPVALPDKYAPPTVGRATRVQWSTELLDPTPALAAFLLVSFGHPPSIPIGSAGFPGCVMHVDSAPGNLWAIEPRVGSILTLDGGRLTLDWTPGPEFRGQEVRLQPLFAVGGRWMWAPCVEAWVGG